MSASLSVLLCTLDRPDAAAQVVQDVLNQRLSAPIEVIVIDQSDDADAARLAEQVRGHCGVRIVRTPRVGLPQARNIALDLASAPVVLFIDDDVRLLPGLLAAHLSALADARVGAIVGRLIERHALPNSRRVRNEVAGSGRVLTQLAGHEPTRVRGVKGANMSFRTEALRRAGGFDARLMGTSLLEDADASARVAALGLQVVFAPEAELVHLSAPLGGVRQADAERTEWWRFHNTALFVGAHHGRVALVRAQAIFSLIAVKRAVSWGRPQTALRLLDAWRVGAQRSQSPRLGYESGCAARYTAPS